LENAGSVALTYSAALTLSATANAQTAGVGETITYTYRVTNTGNVSLAGFVASDTLLGVIALVQDSLTPGQATTGTLTYTVVEANLPGPLTDTATVTGTLFDGSKITNTTSISVALSEDTSGEHIYLPVIPIND
jgi:uncharacterized repeat protein (TIGR01451 family)